MTGNLRLVLVENINGEKHYIVQSVSGDENQVASKDFDVAGVRKIMKKEACKRLLLQRCE